MVEWLWFFPLSFSFSFFFFSFFEIHRGMRGGAGRWLRVLNVLRVASLCVYAAVIKKGGDKAGV